MHIRAATIRDKESVRSIYLHALPESERDPVSRLAVNLLQGQTRPDTVSLVAEEDGALVGHIAFSPVYADNLKRWRGYILAPLAVQPEHQKRHIGSKLIKKGMGQLAENEINTLFVYGDPKFYSKFGFDAETAAGFLPPYDLQYPFGWQAIVLNDYGPTESVIKLSCVDSLCHPELW
jgi:putative acetyltransferase